nr:VOC family protein [Micromonospora violae]
MTRHRSVPTASIMMHLDFMVEDRDAAEARVLAAGATKYEFQPNSGQCFVYAEPAGHPFCLTTSEAPMV